MPDVFFDAEDGAVQLVSALEAEGYAATVTREAFAGEEDWDDRAWVVDVVPWDDRVVELVSAHGGWVPRDEMPAARPTDLPTHPRRLKRGQVHQDD